MRTLAGPVLDVQRPSRLVFRWAPLPEEPDLRTTVELTLEPDGIGVGRDHGPHAARAATVLSVRESGFPPTDAGRRAHHDRATGWGETLTLLRSHLERRPLRHQCV
jgi:uncharacterized protein YndB with AHSA1/START domain